MTYIVLSGTLNLYTTNTTDTNPSTSVDNCLVLNTVTANLPIFFVKIFNEVNFLIRINF